MAGSTLSPAVGGLLAAKGAARPAMRRQSQIQQTGFGSSGMGGLSGWLTGAEDDCGWNDMGEGATPNYGMRSAIGLTAMTDSPESLYVDAGAADRGWDKADWDEADSYDDDSADTRVASPSFGVPSPGVMPAAPANPVGAMQERLHASVAAAPANPARDFGDAYGLTGAEEAPVGLFGSLRAAWARMVAAIVGRGPITVLHLAPDVRERLRNAAYAQGTDEAALAEEAIVRYLSSSASRAAPHSSSYN